jgi:D-tyrosyl-tRNA(Tyr) deacylase
MRAVVQRARAARVEVEGEVVGAIAHGLVCFVGAEEGDLDADVQWVAKKVVDLRIFHEELGEPPAVALAGEEPRSSPKMSRSVLDVGGGLLLVSQFTLFGDVSRGNRPSFTRAMAPEAARLTFDSFVAAVRARAPEVATGRFAADMRVFVENDGPVTILLDSRTR